VWAGQTASRVRIPPSPYLIQAALAGREGNTDAAGARVQQAVREAEQDEDGDDCHRPADARRHSQRRVDEGAERDRYRAAADDAVDHGHDAPEGEELGAPLDRHRRVGEHAEPVVVAGQQEQVRLIPGQLLVVAADPVDGEAVAEVLGAALDHAHERDDAEQVERRQHGERERVERVAAE
jgi:hypothetical protein